MRIGRPARKVHTFVRTGCATVASREQSKGAVYGKVQSAHVAFKRRGACRCPRRLGVRRAKAAIRRNPIVETRPGAAALPQAAYLSVGTRRRKSTVVNNAIQHDRPPSTRRMPFFIEPRALLVELSDEDSSQGTFKYRFAVRRVNAFHTKKVLRVCHCRLWSLLRFYKSWKCHLHSEFVP